MSTQKVLLLLERQGNLAVGEHPIWTPKPGQVLIKVRACALNPIDWKTQKLGIIYDEYPAILGIDIAGDIEVVGEGVTGLKKGDRVLSTPRLKKEMNAFQQYAVADLAHVSRFPDNISYEAASTLPVAFMCAFFGLYGNKPRGAGIDLPSSPGTIGKYKGTPIVILGGSSSVGQYVIQLARHSGFSPIICTSSPAHAAYLEGLGATHVISRSQSDKEIIASIASITAVPIHTVFDTISVPATQRLGYGILAQDGTLIIDLGPEISTEDLEKKNIRLVEALGDATAPWNEEKGKLLYQGGLLNEWLVKEVVKPNRFEVVPDGLAGIPDGLKRLEEGTVSGVKLVARPFDTI